MKDKRLWIVAGLIVSVALTAFVVARLDWVRFGRALSGVNPALLLLAVLPFSVSVMLRALRWTLIVQQPLRLYGRVWSATVLGYLGNYIFPLRAGEVIRVVTLNRLAKVPLGQGTASAVLDRVSDGIALVPLILIVMAIHSSRVLGGMGAVVQAVGVFLVGIIALVAFGVWGHRLQGLVLRLSASMPGLLSQRAPIWYAEALHLVRSYRKLRALVPVLVATLLAFALDSLTTWTLLFAFGLSLPFTAAITLEVFLAVGSALPSAPGYVGIYQAASVLALGLYGVDASSAVAVSLVIQLLFLIVVLLKAGWVAYHYKIRSSLMTVHDPAKAD